MKKNPHAVALGKRTSARKKASSARNGLNGGRPAQYRVVAHIDDVIELQRRVGERWLTLHPPYDAAAKAFLRRR